MLRRIKLIIMYCIECKQMVYVSKLDGRLKEPAELSHSAFIKQLAALNILLRPNYWLYFYVDLWLLHESDRQRWRVARRQNGNYPGLHYSM